MALTSLTMPANAPTVTVVMPVYNDGYFLRAAVESMLAQTFGDIELLVIDDGSSDESRDVLASFHDPRLRVLRNPTNCGLTFSLNLGIEQARGVYLARMDA